MEYYILDELAGNPDIPYIGELPEKLDMIELVMGKPLLFDLPKYQLPDPTFTRGQKLFRLHECPRLIIESSVKEGI